MPKKITNKKPENYQEELRKRIEKVALGYRELHDRYEVNAAIKIKFPQQKIPFLARLAIYIINIYGASLDIQLTDRRRQ